MSDEIRVTVMQYADRPNLVLAYTCPMSGKRKTKSAGTGSEKDAWKAAAAWEEELRAGPHCPPSKVTWETFVARYTAEKLATLRPKTKESALGSLEHVKRILEVDRVAKLNPGLMSHFQAKLRAEGMKDTTLAHHLRHIKAALRWGEKVGLVSKAPAIEMPKRAKGSLAKSRGITAEEVDRLVAVAKKVRPRDAEEWKRFIMGVWHSGLRLSEAVGLTWHQGPFCLDVGGKLPVFVIAAEGQKSDRAETAPTTPDFAVWLRDTYPDAREREGRVFHLIDHRTNQPLASHRVGQILERIGEKAVVKVGTAMKRDKKTGKPVEVSVFAGCHSLRRGFGSKWARKVSPSILKRLMRHSSITTTEGYYITLDAGDVTGELWAEFGPKSGAESGAGNISGNIGASDKEKRLASR